MNDRQELNILSKLHSGRRAHLYANAFARQSVEYARQCGAALLEAQRHCDPELWESYVRENFKGSYGEAVDFMRLAKVTDDEWVRILVEIEADRNCSFSVREIKKRLGT